MTTALSPPTQQIHTPLGDFTLTASSRDSVRVQGSVTVNRVDVTVDLHLKREGMVERYFGSPRSGWVVEHPYYRRSDKSWPDSDNVSASAQTKIKEVACDRVSLSMQPGSDLAVAAERYDLMDDIQRGEERITALKAKIAEQEAKVEAWVTVLAALPEDTSVPVARVVQEME